jgi:hypothetical protein
MKRQNAVVGSETQCSSWRECWPVQAIRNLLDDATRQGCEITCNSNGGISLLEADTQTPLVIGSLMDIRRYLMG